MYNYWRSSKLFIGEVSKITNLPIKTLRFYEEKGLISPDYRNESNKRVYSEENIRWITFVKHLRGTGMALKEIKEFKFLVEKGETTKYKRLEMLEKQRLLTIKQLEQKKEELDHIIYKIGMLRD